MINEPGKPMWYNCKCLHPVKKVIIIDYVMGLEEITHPYCRDVNTNGECKFYEKR
jgi:hypothetical protein